ncbi:MAG: glycoside hydrolase family 3 N-terminal domain-containing protein [Pseudomonadota bacterium]
MKKLYITAACLMALSASAQAQDAAIQKKVNALLAKMTIEEKVGQLHQIAGADLTGPASAEAKNRDRLTDIRNGRIGSLLTVTGAAQTRSFQEMAMQSRLKIPLLFALDVIHGQHVVFPMPLAEAASWDLGAMELSARISATEAAASGVHWTFAPMVDVARDPRWGRVMEGAGEDTFLGSKIATARVRGFQGKRLGDLDAVMATAKHFAAYGAAQAGRDYNTVDMSYQQLHEVYLPPFKAAVDAGVATFMNSFNSLNGIPATGSSMLQRDILRNQWKFKGIVISDWKSVEEMVPHGFASDLNDAAVKAIRAGNDIDMEGYAYTTHLAAAVKAGKVPIARVDNAVGNVLYRKFELGLFDDPFRFSDPERERRVLADPAHRAATREVARKTMVLLKNDKKVLPLAAGATRIALIGPLAESRRDLEGAWIVNTKRAPVVNLAEGIRNAVPGAALTVVAGCDVACTSNSGFDAAVAAARDADVVVMALGESYDQSGEARSRSEIGLPGLQSELFAAVRKATGKPVVVVMLAGRPMVFNSVADQADAILYAWFPGTEGGNAVADVLFGRYNPSGKLPITFPRNVGQIPLSYASYSTGRPQSDPPNPYSSYYIDVANTPRYAFGHGLSYTEFGYGALKLDRATMRAADTLTVSFDLTNKGKVAGEEVVQLYLRDLVSSVVRPVKELKGFQKIMLQPGETRRVSFAIDRSLLTFFDHSLKQVAEPGKFSVMIGSASDDIRAQGGFELLAN